MLQSNKKLLVIKAKEESFWTSCKTISKNLIATYVSLGDREVSFYDLPQDFIKQDALFNTDYIENLYKKIEVEKPSAIVFVDHVPHAGKILKALMSFMKAEKMPPLVFHVYGDFTYFSREWGWFAENYRLHPVKFIAASHAQENLLKFFLNNSSGLYRHLFPLSPKDFYFSAKEREKWRQDNKISNEEIVILYSGRVSLQKNIDILLRKFVEMHDFYNRDFTLMIAGAIDDIGAPFMGVRGYEGYMFSKIQHELKQIPTNIRNKIHFLGNLNQDELRKVNNASDVFWSFSLYHDEDFGMSPAEALATGLPCLLTAWGGYLSFANNTDWACQLVPVNLNEFGHKLDFSNLYSITWDFGGEKYKKERSRRADGFMQSFSIEGSKNRLKEILDEDYKMFEGFAWPLGHLSLAQDQLQLRGSSEQLIPSSENFYGLIYKNYIEITKTS